MVAGMTVSGYIVAAGSVSVITVDNTLMAISSVLGWKGVAAGVASAGTVTRYRVVGAASGAAAGADGCPPQVETVNRTRHATLTIRECIFFEWALRTLEWRPNRGINMNPAP